MSCQCSSNKNIVSEGCIELPSQFSKNFLVDNYFSELDSETKLKKARLNLGIESIQSDWNEEDTDKKTFIKNKPTIPTIPENISAFTNNVGYLTEHQDISGKVNFSELSEVAFSGEYADLKNKPSIPPVPINIADYFNKSITMPKGTYYHLNGAPIHSRLITVEDTVFGGTEDTDVSCLVFCYHLMGETDPHGTTFYAFNAIYENYFSYVGNCSYENAPYYLRKAFGEVDEVIAFIDPQGVEGDGDKEVYERIVSQMSGNGVVQVTLKDIEGYGIVSGNNQWYQGFAYNFKRNTIRIELFGASDEGDDIMEEVRAWIQIVKTISSGEVSYSHTMGYYYPRRTATSYSNGLMSSSDKQKLDNLVKKVDLSSDQTIEELANILEQTFASSQSNIIFATYYDDSDNPREIFGDLDILSGSAIKKTNGEIVLLLVCSHGAAQRIFRKENNTWRTIDTSNRFIFDDATLLKAGLLSITDKKRLDAIYEWCINQGMTPVQ